MAIYDSHNLTGLELFAAEVDGAVFRSGILDVECSTPYYEKISLVKRRFYLPYIQLLALNSPLNCAPHWICAINKVAKRLVFLTGDSFPRRSQQDYVKALCHLAPNVAIPSCLAKARKDEFSDTSAYYLENDVFTAAVYLNLLSVVETMADSIIDRLSYLEITSLEYASRPFEIRRVELNRRGEEKMLSLFEDPFHTAAKYNRAKILELLLDRMASSEVLRYKLLLLKESCLVVAARAGHLETVDLLLNDRWAPFVIWRTLDYEEKRRSEPHFLDSALGTPNKAVFDKIFEYRQKTILKGPIPIPILSRIALQYIVKDNKDMLQWLFKTHWTASRDEFSPKVISRTCRSRQIEMVRFLVTFASPHQKKVPAALSCAAPAGDMELLKLLLEVGSDINESQGGDFPLPPAIVTAILLEHSRMFHFLRERGAELRNSETLKLAVGRAKAAGLDSMLELLVTEGVDIDLWPPFIPPDNSARFPSERLLSGTCEDCNMPKSIMGV
jgi:hypothetical protein